MRADERQLAQIKSVTESARIFLRTFPDLSMWVKNKHPHSFYVSTLEKEWEARKNQFKMDLEAQDELDKGIILVTKSGSYFVLPLRIALESKTIKDLRNDVETTNLFLY